MNKVSYLIFGFRFKGSFVSRNKRPSFYGTQSTGAMLFEEVVCSGEENSILNCSRGPPGSSFSCTHDNDAAVTCREGMYVLCPGDMTLLQLWCVERIRENYACVYPVSCLWQYSCETCRRGMATDVSCPIYIYMQDIATAVTCGKGMAIDVLCPVWKTLSQL